jgi:hypothetical protein
VRERNIQSAIDAVNMGAPVRFHGQVIRGPPYTTLSARLHGATTVNEALLPKQRLSPEEEAFLASWQRNEGSLCKGSNEGPTW